MLTGAVMFGRAKNQCGILLEPAAQYAIDPNDKNELPKFRNMIWSANLITASNVADTGT